MRNLIRFFESRPPQQRRPLYLLILIIAGGWVWWTAPPSGTISMANISAPQTGFSAPDFTLQSSTGEPVTLSDLQGQPVILNLWASWCGPCRAEMPALERVHKTYKDQGLKILAVNATNQDSQSAALNFASEHQLTFTILLDHDGRVSNSYRLQALPSTYFINPDGTIQEIVIGGPMAEALLRSRVEQFFSREGIDQ